MTTLTSPSAFQPIIFDGADENVSFDEFVRQFEDSPDWSDFGALAGYGELEYTVPSHLYGDALRYYETLDPDCQYDWSQLLQAMTRRFPGPLKKGEIIPWSTMQGEVGLRTLAQAPPVTSILQGPKGAISKEGHSGSADGEADKHE
ncbi:hypothetical protein FRC00_005876, partial [Tulasnella sp. 408]